MNTETNTDSGATPPPRGGHHLRRIKIEASGDFWKRLVRPKIRLMGRWLERAGFKPGEHVEITPLAPGLLQLRSTSSGQSRRSIQTQD